MLFASRDDTEQHRMYYVSMRIRPAMHGRWNCQAKCQALPHPDRHTDMCAVHLDEVQHFQHCASMS